MIFQNPHPLKRTAIHARTELLLILAAIVNELVPERLLVTLVSILHVLQTELSTPSVHSETPRIILGRKIDFEIFTKEKFFFEETLFSLFTSITNEESEESRNFI